MKDAVIGALIGVLYGVGVVFVLLAFGLFGARGGYAVGLWFGFYGIVCALVADLIARSTS